MKKTTKPAKKPKTRNTRIDPRHVSFVNEYLFGDHKGNAYQCALIAKFSERTAFKQSSSWVGINRDMCRNKTLWDMVKAKEKEIGVKYGITEQEVMDGYIRDERFDPIHLVNPETGLPQTDLREITKEARLSLRGLKVRQQILKSDDETQVIKQTSEFQYPDKKGNRDSIAKILGMMKEKDLPDGVESIDSVTITFQRKKVTFGKPAEKP